MRIVSGGVMDVVLVVEEADLCVCLTKWNKFGRKSLLNHELKE